MLERRAFLTDPGGTGISGTRSEVETAVNQVEQTCTPEAAGARGAD